MGSESIAHEAEGRMGYWLLGHEGERNNWFSKIQLVGQKNIETKHLSLVKARLFKVLMFWRQKRIKILFCRQNIANTADAFATSGLEIRWKLFFKSPWAWRMLNQRHSKVLITN